MVAGRGGRGGPFEKRSQPHLSDARAGEYAVGNEDRPALVGGIQGCTPNGSHRRDAVLDERRMTVAVDFFCLIFGQRVPALVCNGALDLGEFHPHAIDLDLPVLSQYPTQYAQPARGRIYDASIAGAVVAVVLTITAIVGSPLKEPIRRLSWEVQVSRGIVELRAGQDHFANLSCRERGKRVIVLPVAAGIIVTTFALPEDLYGVTVEGEADILPRCTTVIVGKDLSASLVYARLRDAVRGQQPRFFSLALRISFSCFRRPLPGPHLPHPPRNRLPAQCNRLKPCHSLVIRGNIPHGRTPQCRSAQNVRCICTSQRLRQVLPKHVISARNAQGGIGVDRCENISQARVERQCRGEEHRGVTGDGMRRVLSGKIAQKRVQGRETPLGMARGARGVHCMRKYALGVGGSDGGSR
mmetsp:Transcript_10861/g.32141  ORF Transcript_10861/g.32141 Transcript_10861/m.32141 type:complete len:412 (+) Transcript_10861:1492-2727(+)